MRLSLKETLIKMGYSPEDAEDEIKAAREALQAYIAEDDTDGAYGICEEFWGLEPDYIDELL